MSAPVIHPEVRAFVEEVRAALDDLTAEEVEELTGGLEADLDDAAAERESLGAEGNLADRLGDPVAYAAELRSAAGLPPRAAGGEPPQEPGLVGGGIRSLRRRWTQGVHRLEAWPQWPLVREHAALLRPVWWVLRAWVAFQVLHMVVRSGAGDLFPPSLAGLLLVLLLLAASLETGRRTRLAEADPVWGNASRRARWARRLLLAGNVAAVLSLLPAVNHVTTREWYPALESVAPSPGLWLNGTEVRNIFPYDARGNPLTGVQLFDENGNRLAVGESAQMPLFDTEGNNVAQVPAVGQDSAPLWNVFPLRQRVIPPYTEPAPEAGRTLPWPAALPTPPIGPLLAPAPTGTPNPAPTVPTVPTEPPVTVP